MFKDLALRVCITFNEATKIHVKLSLMRFILSTSFQKHFLPNFELPNLKCSLISASCAYMLPSLIDGILHVSPYHSRKCNCTRIISGLTSKYISVTLTTDKDGFFQQDQESYCCILVFK